MEDDHPIVPITTSLQDYQVPINQDVRQLLTDQLLVSHKNDANAAQQHMDRILNALKSPPTPSLLRIDYCSSVSPSTSRDQVIENLKLHFQEHWSDATVTLKPHPVFSDVIEIHVDHVGTDDDHATTTTLLSHHSKPPVDSAPILFHNWPRRKVLGWPMTHRIVLCDRLCAEAVLRGSHIFVKGILCVDAGTERGENVAVYGYVGSDATKPTQGSTLDHCDVAVRGTCLFLGMGKTHGDRMQLVSKANGIGVSMTLLRAGPILPPLHNIGNLGRIQNLPSIFVGHALDPQPGDIILDMCCAPGGKTTHLASLVRGKATIVACDKSRSKILSVRDLIAATGAMDCITLLALDATKCVADGEDTKSTVLEILGRAPRKDDGLLDVLGFPPESFDRILLDPPCSALGLRPKLGIRIKAKELVKTAEYQRHFLRQSFKLLKPGGILTYSTCTINALENEQNVAFMLQEYSSFMTLVPLSTEGPGQAGLAGHGLNDEQRKCVKRFDPSDEQDNCMGFFVAKFQKKMI